MARDRRRWRAWQRYMDPARFVFLDETGASTNMVRRYGWASRGERLVDAEVTAPARACSARQNSRRRDTCAIRCRMG